MRPRAALARLWPVVGAPATVLVRVETRASALARHRVPTSRLDGQLGRTPGVQVGHAAGRLAVIAAVPITGRHEPADRRHPHRQVVPVHQAYVVVVQSVGALESHLRQRHGWHAPGPVALDPITCANKPQKLFLYNFKRFTKPSLSKIGKS